MQHRAIIVFFLALLCQAELAYAATQQDYKRLSSDFPRNILYRNSDNFDADDFPAIVYVDYLARGQCSRAGIWREEIKTRSQPLYDYVMGVAYGNGDCIKYDAQKSEQHLLVCLDTTKGARSSLLALYQKEHVFNEDVARLAYGMAINGSGVGIDYLIAFHSRGKTAIDLYWLCVWHFVLDEQFAPREDPMVKVFGVADPNHSKMEKLRADFRKVVHNELAQLSKRIPHKQFLEIQKVSKSLAADIYKNSEKRRAEEEGNRKVDSHISSHLYGILSEHGYVRSWQKSVAAGNVGAFHNFPRENNNPVGSLKKSSPALPERLQRAEDTEKNENAALKRRLEADIAQIVKSAEALGTLR